MVVALYVVSLAMVIGGLASIYFGSDIIVMERGWTMVIAGSVIAASGVLLAGIATVVARLVQLEQEFGRIADRLAGGQTAPMATLSAQAPASSPQAASASRDTFADVLAQRDFAQRDVETAPDSLFAPQAAAASSNGSLRAAPPVPMPPPPAPPAESEPEPSARFAEAGDVFAPSGSEEPSQAAVVGTYSSGGNFYIMYSDGSIEAETPAGKFRFNSLDELKDFIAAGGDKPKAARPA
jgi:hypothetical protein